MRCLYALTNFTIVTYELAVTLQLYKLSPLSINDQA